ncbi:MAG: class I SAM-dependent methyltransferase [Planctomycetes bacterium]|nr:class I SAM-dependent methyltransferase [Planctomycetota bacterium]
MSLAVFSESPTGYGYDFYRHQKASGVDLLDYGEWQRKYGQWIVDALGLAGQRVLDVGSACGSTLRAILEAGADIDGVDCSEVLVQLGRDQWPDMGGRLMISDAVNLHGIPDASYDWLHSLGVAEHWRPALVPHILAELRRVVKPGGSFYCAFETAGGVMTNGRNPAEEPTHLCLRTSTWWDERLRKSGWQLTSAAWLPVFQSHPDSARFQSDWSWFIAQRPE